MLRAKSVTIVIFIIALLLLSGCDLFKQPVLTPVTLNISGFPFEYDSYYLEIYAIIQGSDPTKIKELPGVELTQTLNETLDVDATSSELVVYLFSGQGEPKPVYFATIPYDSAVKSYTILYWLDYASYADGSKRFGISRQLARTVEGGMVEELDFINTPYYLYQVHGVENNSLTIRLNITQGEVNYSSGNSLAVGAASSYTGQKLISLWNYPDEELYILLTPESYDQTVRGTVTIETYQQIAISGTITDMVTSTQPGRIYATARVTGGIGETFKLYYINPLEKSIDREFTLPSTLNPISLVYSELTQKLYILSSSLSATIGIWDPATESVTTYQYATSTGGRDIGIDPLNRYLYIASNTGLYIVDLDNPATVLQSYSLNLYNFELDLQNRRLIGTDGSYLYRYALKGTQLTEQQRVSVPIVFGSKVMLGPEKRKVYYLNATTRAIVCLDASNLLSKLGTWQLEYAPDELGMSPDGSLLYAVDGGTVGAGSSTYLYVFNEHNPAFGIIRKFPYPNTFNAALIALNSDGSVLVGYSREYNTFTKQYISSLRFYSNIQLVATLTVRSQSYDWPSAGNRYTIF